MAGAFKARGSRRNTWMSNPANGACAQYVLLSQISLSWPDWFHHSLTSSLDQRYLPCISLYHSISLLWVGKTANMTKKMAYMVVYWRSWSSGHYQTIIPLVQSSCISVQHSRKYTKCTQKESWKHSNILLVWKTQNFTLQCWRLQPVINPTWRFVRDYEGVKRVLTAENSHFTSNIVRRMESTVEPVLEKRTGVRDPIIFLGGGLNNHH